MIRTDAVPRPLRIGAGVAAVAATFALAGCAPTDAGGGTEAPAAGPSRSSAPGSGASEPAAPPGDSTYADGTYTADGSYATPESVETITVTVNLEDDVIAEVSVVGDPQKRESEEYQGRFIGGIADAVVGRDIDEIAVSRVAGSSLTSGGFNQAIETIKFEAAA
ncbi:FMN-binding protein [Microbacterium sp. zg.B48]|uniref:FMN-binding protein n=1 Tax=Microbacterium sp. zg.B48 TaxID=2969408 RepID=UPI00214AE4EC|nr:FMN-binding protein [Microbacterium sp. zg.B48]MCR2762336.1 FMN-binding protein [Microbacterium sp. zg.B48]